MLRSLVTRAFRQARPFIAPGKLNQQPPFLSSKLQQSYSCMKISSSHMSTSLSSAFSTFIRPQQPLNILARVAKPVQVEQKRTLLNKYSLTTGRRKSNHAVIRRFLRLNWGMWIHVRSGREKRLWKKTGKRKKRLRYHVMCNATQCTLLDKMVTKFWRRERFLVNDPYAPYHKRENFYQTRKAPLELPSFK